MLERGVYLPPAQFEAAFVSLAHTGGGHRRDGAGGRGGLPGAGPSGLRGALLLVLAVLSALIALLWTAVALQLIGLRRRFVCLADVEAETPPGGWP